MLYCHSTGTIPSQVLVKVELSREVLIADGALVYKKGIITGITNFKVAVKLIIAQTSINLRTVKQTITHWYLRYLH